MKMIDPRSGATRLGNASLQNFFVEVGSEPGIILALWEWRCGPLPGLSSYDCVMQREKRTPDGGGNHWILDHAFFGEMGAEQWNTD
jgi:hypothetical protein